jgi:hypothetical protein
MRDVAGETPVQRGNGARAQPAHEFRADLPVVFAEACFAGRRECHNRVTPPCGHLQETTMSFEAILRGTPVWVWVLLVFLLSRGIKAFKGGTAPLGKLAIVPVVFAVWGIAHLATERAAGWQAAVAWVLGAVAGLLAGAFIARKTSFTVDRMQKTVTVPGSAVPLILILVTFASKFWLGVELAISAPVPVDSGYVVLDGLISGIVAGIFAGRFLVYCMRFRAREAVPVNDSL